MFVHAVLFQIAPKEVLDYRNDSKMWARYTKKTKGFIAYFTMRRVDHQNQYVSVYLWKNKQAHTRFMQTFHDYLVAKSKATEPDMGATVGVGVTGVGVGEAIETVGSGIVPPERAMTG